MARKTKVITISLQPKLLHQIDRFCRETIQHRSEFIRSAVFSYAVELIERRDRMSIAAKQLKMSIESYEQDKKEIMLELGSHGSWSNNS